MSESGREDDRSRVFERLLREHGAAVRRFAASYEQDVARRQDLLQDIWLALWTALPSFRGACAERTFVFRIAHNRAVSHVNHWRIRRTEPIEHVDPIDERAPSPEQRAMAVQSRAHLLAAVAALPLGLRQTTVLMLEGLTQREIADVLGISENNVAVRMTRARAALSRALEARRNE